MIFCQGTENRSLELYYDNYIDHKMKFTVTDSEENQASADMPFNFNNEWHLVCISWDKDEGIVHMWIDGVEGNSNGIATNNLIVSDTNFIFGEDDWSEGESTWEDFIDEWRIHTNIPYTEAEDKMKKLWNNGLGYTGVTL